MFRVGKGMGVGGSAVFLVLGFLGRLYLYHTYMHGIPQRPMAVAPERLYAPAPASSWLTFVDADQDTQTRVHHARLSADPEADAAEVPQAVPPKGAAHPWRNSLELRMADHDAPQAILSLAHTAPANCTAISGAVASFDADAEQEFAAKANASAGACEVVLAGFSRLLNSLLNAQTLTLTPKMGDISLPGASFHVAGLVWNTD